MTPRPTKSLIQDLSPSVRVTVADTIKALGTIEPELRRAATIRVKQAAGPMVQLARSLVPPDTPMSGWKADGWKGGWNPARIRAGIKVQFRANGRYSASYGVSRYIPLLTLIQTDAVGAIYDMAGRKTEGSTAHGKQFVRNLNTSGGLASRTMWKAALATIGTVESALRDAVADMETTINERVMG